MSARAKILQRLAGRRNAPSEKPELPPSLRQPDELIRPFGKALNAAGGELELLDDPDELEPALARSLPKAGRILDTRRTLAKEGSPDERFSWDLVILEGKLGVAENGAVWVEWEERYPRSVLTLAETLVLILPRGDLVATMQEAYEALDLSSVAYGLFLAGPSKTADIEQALVIGAHGAVTLKVFLV